MHARSDRALTPAGTARGLDLGGTHIKLARRDAVRGPILDGDGAEEDVPVAIAYADGRPTIGRAASALALANPTAGLALDITPLLAPDTEPGRAAAQIRLPRPIAEVIRDLLAEIVTSNHGPVHALTIALPEAWRQIASIGPTVLEQILSEDPNLPAPRFITGTVAAAAHVLTRSPPDKLVSSLLLCDAGGTTFTASLFAVQGTTLDLVDHRSTSSAGRAFDHALTRRAFALRHQREYGSLEQDRVEYLRLLIAIDEKKRTQHHQDGEVIRLVWEPSRYRSAPLYEFDDVTLTVNDVRDAFAPIGRAIDAAIQELKAQQSLDDAHLAIVGGFARFPPVRDAVYAAIGLNPRDDRVLDQQLDDRDRLGAAAFGALAIAEGQLDPRIMFPDTVTVPMSGIRHGQFQRTDYVFGAAGGLEQGGFLPCYLADQITGTVLPVRVERGRSFTVEVGHGSEGRTRALPITSSAHPPAGDYHVGLQVHPSRQGSLVFRPLGGGAVTTIPLPDLATGED